VLHLVQKESLAPKAMPANVELTTRYIPDQELQTMQNRFGIHLCPSRVEGWGITSSRACHGRPDPFDRWSSMNEHLDASTGLLVPYVRTEPRHLGTCYIADLAALEAQIDCALTMSAEDKAKFGRASRLALSGSIANSVRA